ncbi:Predicted kinase [Eubacterium uniforme]|uniref:Predicted kinase n=2 Tax=Eubacteriaceae TaxID=186806 RepID=A0A1T4VML6_9FIRM|nr:Predicted kinase [Eubacterium uniforme]
MGGEYSRLFREEGKYSMKKLILVTSPPACGKSFVTRRVAKEMKNCVYLDKDSLIVLSKQIFLVAHENYNRSSDFFEEYIRDPEYDAIMQIAYEALDYNDTVFVNAPFTREIEDKEYMDKLKADLARRDTKLVVIWVHTSIEACKRRMISRNSDRDTWKLENWDEYVKSRNFNPPAGVDDVYIFENSTDEEFKDSLDKVIKYLKSI